MNRGQALVSLRVAGAENDHKEFIRIYTENRISYKVAVEEFRTGQGMSRKTRLVKEKTIGGL